MEVLYQVILMLKEMNVFIVDDAAERRIEEKFQLVKLITDNLSKEDLRVYT